MGEIHAEPSTQTSFDIHVTVTVNATPEQVYAVATDVTRMGEWSPECTGAEWTKGEPATVGARFEGHNRFGDDTWSTENEVVAAEPERRFAWEVLTYAPENMNSVWSFEFEPDGDGTLLTQRYAMRQPSTKLQGFMTDMTPERAEQFLQNRRAMLQDGMRQTVDGVKRSVEGG